MPQQNLPFRKKRRIPHETCHKVGQNHRYLTTDTQSLQVPVGLIALSLLQHV